MKMFQYISNAGIILDVEGMRVGIDCLCKDSVQLYQDTPLEIREELKLDILIFTHEHEDHFCAEYVKEAWEKNPLLQIYSTKTTIECLKQINVPNENLHQVQDGETLSAGDSQILFIETIHEGEQYLEIQNLTLLINKKGKQLVITGDAMPCRELFAKIGKWSPCVDGFFAPFPYVGLKSNRKLICEYLIVYNIFLLHFPRQGRDEQRWTENTKKVCEQANDNLPRPVFLEKPGEWYEI